MRGPPGDSVEAFEELRRLLLSGEREQLRDLRDRLNNRERRSKDVAGVLPEAVKLSGERGEELVQALRPAVEGSIKQSIEKKPDTFVGALHPIIGRMVRRSIAESLRHWTHLRIAHGQATDFPRGVQILFHQPIFMISSLEMPALRAELAAPRRKE